MERSAIFAGGNFRIRALRFGAPVVVEEGDDVVEDRVVTMETREIHLRQFDRCHLTRAQQLAEIAQRPERDVFEIRGPLHRRNRTQPERQPRLADVHAGHNRAEVERRRHIRRNVQLAQFLVAGEVAIRRLDEGLLLLFADVNTRQLQRIVDHRQRHALGAGVLHARPQNPGHERGAETGAGKGRHEPPPSRVECAHKRTSMR